MFIEDMKIVISNTCPDQISTSKHVWENNLIRADISSNENVFRLKKEGRNPITLFGID